MTAGGTLEITSEGSVVVGDAFRAAELAWYEGLAAIARGGTALIVDEVFLGGGASQDRLRQHSRACPCSGSGCAATRGGRSP